MPQAACMAAPEVSEGAQTAAFLETPASGSGRILQGGGPPDSPGIALRACRAPGFDGHRAAACSCWSGASLLPGAGDEPPRREGNVALPPPTRNHYR